MLSNQGQETYGELLHKIAYQLRQTSTKERSSLMVVGVPNVGKSTIINRLRALGVRKGGHAVKVGDLPGVTRSVSGMVRILDDPLTYLWDSPGVLMPKIKNVTQGLKLAITGAIMDSVVGDHLLLDYLYAFLSSRDDKSFLRTLKLETMPEGSLKFIEQVAKANGRLNRNGSINSHNAISLVLKSFRRGELGRFTLDDVKIDARNK